ncbi:MAG: TlpA disulfide reductase family protein [Fimbriimonadaceae bacterium]
MKVLLFVGILLALSCVAGSRIFGQQTPFTTAEKAIDMRIGKLRQTPDNQRGAATKSIALDLRKLPPTNDKVLLAYALANLSTEGDFGHDALQQVATTLATALHERPQPDEQGAPASVYVELAQLARYEHVKVRLVDPAYQAAVTELAAMHADQAKVDFTLQDITGKTWTRSALKGKVVLVNFWATWCPPCRKEMPDLERLYKEFGDRGFVVLAISDEVSTTVAPFIAKQGYTFPILLDPGRKVNTAYHVQGIPNSFLYNRQGKLVAQAIDMRTRGQFLKMLASVGFDSTAP